MLVIMILFVLMFCETNSCDFQFKKYTLTYLLFNIVTGVFSGVEFFGVTYFRSVSEGALAV